MKYILGFLRFWRHFIVGDDNTIAITIMWMLLLVWSLATNLIDAWFVMPVTVIAILFGKTLRRQRFAITSPLVKLFITVVFPMIIVTAIPLLLFRYFNGETDIRLTLVPLSIYIVIAMVVGGALNLIYRRFPLFSVFAAGCLSYLLVIVWQPPVIRFATFINDQYPVPTFLGAYIVPIFFITCCITLFQNRHDMSL